MKSPEPDHWSMKRLHLADQWWWTVVYG